MVSDQAFNTIIDGAAMVIQRARAAEATVEAQKRTIEDLRKGTGKDAVEQHTTWGQLDQACQLLEKVKEIFEPMHTEYETFSKIVDFLDTVKQDHPQLHLKP